MTPGFDVIVCADWSKDPRSRAVCVAHVTSRLLECVSPKTSWSVPSVLRLARTLGKGGPVLVGFDAPLGTPGSYWRCVGAVDAWRECRHFAEWLPAAIPLPGLLDELSEPLAWTPTRPFLSLPAGKGSRTAWEAHLEESFGVQPLRAIDRLTSAKSAFIVSGIPGSVGAAARDLWAGLVAERAAGGAFSIWPFEGSLPRLIANRRLTVGEIYPRAAYAVALSEREPEERARLTIAKTSSEARIAALEVLAESRWIRQGKVTLPDVTCAERSENAFDALLAAAALLRCTIEGTPLSDEDLEDPIAEGGILASGSLNLGLPEQTLKAQ